MEHFQNNMLSDTLYEFRRKRYFELQLILVIKKLAKSLHNGEQTGIILLDLQKPLDISHNKLLNKLNQYGIKGSCTDEVRAFYQIKLRWWF